MFKNRGQNDKLMDIITNSLSEDPNDSKNLVKKIGNKKFGLEGRVASKTLQGWEFGNMTINEFSKAAMESERRGLEKRLVFLSTLGNNAPFIGLLGTVLGIMKAFRDLATMGDAGPAVVMAGISEALVATAFGLGVAIPCVIIFNIFTKQVKNKLSNAEEIVKMISGMRAAFEIKINTSLNDDPEKNSKIKKDKNNKEIDKVDLPDLAIEIA
ncbi:MAG: MotA/TolQ/ExbB proton channel family protein [Spirochaetota bacterium]|nr:MotA/TolQ/ExbB proton channel family protein [Spirochaetota bacterium]